MSAEIRQDLRLTQQLVMTPQLQMAIKLLQLSRLDLIQQLHQELEQNPVLEQTLDTEKGNLQETPAGLAADDTENRKDNTGDIDWQTYIEEHAEASRIRHGFESGEEEETESDLSLTKKTTLTDHLTWQLHLSDFTPKETDIGTLIIGNIDENGYLMITVEEIASEMNINKDEVEAVLKKIQQFDPVGIAARDIKECILIQATFLPDKNRVIIEEIVNKHLNDLEKKNYKKIAKALNVHISRVIDAVKVISHLEPRPGRAFGEDESQVIIPDVYIQKVGNDYVILLNEDGLPKLRISPYYRDMLAKNGSASDNVKSYIQERLRSAVWLIKSIHQRQRTIYRVAESIVKFHREFMDNGIGFLKPLILRDVARDIGMHESTVSRVTTNKYAHTPQGIFELKYFFNSGISKDDGSNIAAESVKERIRKLISSENPKKPLSDQKISKLLKGSGIDIARRTVAKYREAIRIFSSSERRVRF
ncbi:MAG TPA: RNA polymerase sigma-54 factor [Deltaproteobacteria bacterium]|nr:RNA polymerase sigma-54 factor [Deltaproteobacteria bacterium]